jgi:hypothetical protein
MVSEIRKATNKERGLARTFSNEIDSPGKQLAEKAEKIGFRVIYRQGEKDHLPVLTPSGYVVDWDFDTRSLESLPRVISDLILSDTEVYLATVAIPYLREQGVDVSIAS